jgi:hypothetical protein
MQYSTILMHLFGWIKIKNEKSSRLTAWSLLWIIYYAKCMLLTKFAVCKSCNKLMTTLCK